VNRFFRDENLEELTRKTYDSMGLEVRDVLARSDLYERDGKNQHGFCLAVGRDHPYDVRVLVNVRPDSYWMDTMLHEFGHAVYDKHINPRLPYFLRTIAHTCTTEAIALMMGSLVDDPAWLSAITGVSEAELEDIREHILWRERADRMVFTRWALVMFNFERGYCAASRWTVASTTPTASGPSSTPAVSSLRTSRMAYAPLAHILTRRPVSHTSPRSSRNSRSTCWP
jgi:peptidyl-dipeptidase A